MIRTGIAAYLKNDGIPEKAIQMVNCATTRTTQLNHRRCALDEMERVIPVDGEAEVAVDVPGFNVAGSAFVPGLEAALETLVHSPFASAPGTPSRNFHGLRAGCFGFGAGLAFVAQVLELLIREMLVRSSLHSPEATHVSSRQKAHVHRSGRRT